LSAQDKRLLFGVFHTRIDDKMLSDLLKSQVETEQALHESRECGQAVKEHTEVLIRNQFEIKRLDK